MRGTRCSDRGLVSTIVVGQRPDVVPAEIRDQLRVPGDGGVVVVDQTAAGQTAVLVEPARRCHHRLVWSNPTRTRCTACGDPPPRCRCPYRPQPASCPPRRSCDTGRPHSSRPGRPPASTPSTTPTCSSAGHRTRRCSCRPSRGWPGGREHRPHPPPGVGKRRLAARYRLHPGRSAQNGLCSPFISMNSRKITGTPSTLSPSAACAASSRRTHRLQSGRCPGHRRSPAVAARLPAGRFHRERTQAGDRHHRDHRRAVSRRPPVCAALGQATSQL